MKITICGSMFFVKEMEKLKENLEKLGHTVFVPIEVDGIDYDNKDSEMIVEAKLTLDLIKTHYNKILDSDAIIVINFDKKGIKNYVGGNTFLEMGFAHVNDRKIYLMNPVPRELGYYEEMEGMKPIIINGDLTKIQ